MKNKILSNSLNKSGVRELLRKTGEYLESGSLNTVVSLSSIKLIRAMENEEYGRMITLADMIIFEDIEVLKALGIATPARSREVEENKYLKEFLRKLVKEQREILLAAENDEQLELLEKELKSLQSNLNIVGRSAADRYLSDKESFINSVNLLAPEVVLSRMSSSMDLEILYEYSNYLNASLWMVLPDKLVENKKAGWLDKINKFICKKLLNKKINHSKDTEKSGL